MNYGETLTFDTAYMSVRQSLILTTSWMKKGFFPSSAGLAWQTSKYHWSPSLSRRLFQNERGGGCCAPSLSRTSFLSFLATLMTDNGGQSSSTISKGLSQTGNFNFSRNCQGQRIVTDKQIKSCMIKSIGQQTISKSLSYGSICRMDRTRQCLPSTSQHH
jgi:hypothetical protein